MIPPIISANKIDYLFIITALIVELPLTLDVPIGLVQISSSNTSLLSVSYNQLFAKNKFNYIPGQYIYNNYLNKTIL